MPPKMSAGWTFQTTLDDLDQVASPQWTNYVSSAIGIPGTVYNASVALLDGATISFLNPIAAYAFHLVPCHLPHWS
jgi:hypothetical protein